MKRLLFAFLLPAFCFGNEAFAQETLPATNSPMITGFTLIPSTTVENSPKLSLGDFNTLFPNSMLLSSPSLKGLDQNSNSLYSGGGGLGLLVSLKTKEKTYGNTTISSGFRIGVNYQSRALSNSYFKTSSGVIDTLRSANGGEQIYLDTVNSQNLSLTHRSEMIGLDVSYLYRINPSARWSFFGGLGTQVGASINNRTDIYYSSYRYREYRKDDGSIVGGEFSNDRNNSTSVSETNRNRSGFYAMVYVPLGVNFRIGKTSEFWKRTNLFYEMRPMLNISSIPELGTFAGIGIQHGLGLRITVQ